ncbi:MAG: hypothetical protein R2932_33725 [Caldilineaceae bacterium]
MRYRLLLHNDGPQRALGVTLDNALPLEAYAVGCQADTGGSCQVNANQIAVTYPTIDAHTATPITLTWSAPAQSGAYTNTAVAASSNLSDSVATAGEHFCCGQFLPNRGRRTGCGSSDRVTNHHGHHLLYQSGGRKLGDQPHGDAAGCTRRHLCEQRWL